MFIFSLMSSGHSNIHRCLHFDLAADCYSGEIQELASVKRVLNNFLPSFGGFLVVCWGLHLFC